MSTVSQVCQQAFLWIRFQAPHPLNRKLVRQIPLPLGWRIRKMERPFTALWLECRTESLFADMSQEQRDQFAAALLLIPEKAA